MPTSYKAISFDAIMKLPDFWNETTHKHEAPVNRTKWKPEHHAVTEPFEGVAVSIVGYINRAKRQDQGGGESTNCHYKGDHKFVDIHVALVEDFDDLESEALVVEPTPRFYATHPKWVWLKMIDLEGSKDPVPHQRLDAVRSEPRLAYGQVPQVHVGDSPNHEDRDFSRREVGRILGRV